MQGKHIHWLAVTLVLGAATISAPANAEKVQGLVRGVGAAEATKSTIGYWKVWNGVVKPRAEAHGGDAIAVITGRTTTAAIGCSVAFRGGSLSGTTLAARAGSTLRVHNEDSFTHRLVVDLVKFTPVETPPGKSRDVEIASGGPWLLTDAYNEHVRSHLHAIPDLVACAPIDGQGRFRFANVPPGTYVLRILNGAHELTRREVNVMAGQALELDALSALRKGRK